MNLYLIKRRDKDIDYDEYMGFVVASYTPNEARQLIAAKAADEGKQAWLNTHNSKLIRIGVTAFTKPRIILESFNAG